MSTLPERLNAIATTLDRCQWHAITAAQDCRDAAERIKELEAIVASLPKTADGVPTVPGMEAFVLLDGLPYSVSVDSVGHSVDLKQPNRWGSGTVDPARWLFSSREAAEAAKEKP